MHQVSVDKYCARIGYSGALNPSLSTLNAIIFAHVQTIPFENLDVLLGRNISLDLAKIEAKLLSDGRGGYCFEHNTLLLSILDQLGFSVTPISARVRFGRAQSETPPRTHVFLRIDLEDDVWLADVGVGGLSPTSALRLEADVEQPTPHELRRILRQGAWSNFSMRAPDACLLHQVKLGDEWHNVCEFTLEPMPPIDRELGNWFTSAHPNSHFRGKLMVARGTPTGRVTLLNREFNIRDRLKATETVFIESANQLFEILERHFDLRFPSGTQFQCNALDWQTHVARQDWA